MSEKNDRELGMDRQIPRRDFLNGMSITIGGALIPQGEFWSGVLGADEKPYAPEKDPAYYPKSVQLILPGSAGNGLDLKFLDLELNPANVNDADFDFIKPGKQLKKK